jgi:hypothetical protein
MGFVARNGKYQAVYHSNYDRYNEADSDVKCFQVFTGTKNLETQPLSSTLVLLLTREVADNIVAISKVLGLLVIRMSNDRALPFNYLDYAGTRLQCFLDWQ